MRKPTIRMWPQAHLVARSCRHATTRCAPSSQSSWHHRRSRWSTSPCSRNTKKTGSSRSGGKCMEAGNCSKLTSSSQSTESTAPVTATCTDYNSTTSKPGSKHEQLRPRMSTLNRTEASLLHLLRKTRDEAQTVSFRETCRD